MAGSIKLNTAKLDLLTAKLLPRAERVLDKSASDVENGWKEFIVQKGVVDTGAYLNSVHVEASHQPLKRTVADGVNYGVFQEFGTRHFPARPCAQPAVERVRAGFLKAFEGLFK